MTNGGAKWRVYGRVVGPNLPSSAVTLGEVTLGPLPEGVTLEAGPTLSSPTVELHSGHGWQVPISRLAVSSDTYFWTDVEAESQGEAVRQVEQQSAVFLRTSLSLQSHLVPYQIQIIEAQQQTGAKISNILTSKFMLHTPSELTEQQRLDAQIVYRCLLRDNAAAKAASLFHVAITQETVSRSQYDDEAALLAYFRAVEVLAREADFGGPIADNIDNKKNDVIRRLVRELRKNTGVLKKTRAIERAQFALSRLDARALNDKIELLGVELGLSGHWTSQAKEFNKLRSKRLAHGGHRPSQDERKRWLKGGDDRDSAYELVSQLLRAYCTRAATL